VNDSVSTPRFLLSLLLPLVNDLDATAGRCLRSCPPRIWPLKMGSSSRSSWSLCGSILRSAKGSTGRFPSKSIFCLVASPSWWVPWQHCLATDYSQELSKIWDYIITFDQEVRLFSTLLSSCWNLILKGGICLVFASVESTSAVLHKPLHSFRDGVPFRSM